MFASTDDPDPKVRGPTSATADSAASNEDANINVEDIVVVVHVDANVGSDIKVAAVDGVDNNGNINGRDNNEEEEEEDEEDDDNEEEEEEEEDNEAILNSTDNKYVRFDLVIYYA